MDMPANNMINTQYEGLSLLGLDRSDVRVLVVGLGVTGLSVVKFLTANNIQVAVIDSRDNPPGLEAVESEYKGIGVFTGGFSEDAFNAATHIIASPGISLDEPLIEQAAERGVPIFGDIDLFAVCAKAPIACITGSNGKSTVTTLLGEMAKSANLSVQIGGNLGVPALDLLAEENTDLYVIELSSFQLERTSYLNASVSTILNISADHMDRYASLLTYSQAKARVLHGDGVKILNRQDTAVMELLDKEMSCVTFGLDMPVKGGSHSYGLIEKNGLKYLSKGQQPCLSITDVAMKGTHNIANALAAMAMADALDIPVDSQYQALRTFSGLEHRTQSVPTTSDIIWINDSKATNVGACLAALEGLDAPIILIAGGDGKGASFAPLADVIEDKVSSLILLGKDAQAFKKEAANKTPCDIVDSIEQAVQLASQYAESGDTVLLSPACASLDQFSSYQERGNRFIAAIESLES